MSRKQQKMRVVLIPALEDNYFYLVVCETTQEAAFIDPCDVRAAITMANKWQVAPKQIFNTHHHWDHIGANEELKKHFDATIMGPKGDENRIPGIDKSYQGGDSIRIGNLEGKVISTPGHTKHHVSLHFPEAKALFCGDTLFSAGCGRLFEGTPEEMVESLYNKILKLPDDTQIFCGHEYTENNLAFARAVEPDNPEIRAYSKRVAALRHRDRATVPTTLAQEKKINPFLRCGSSRNLFETMKARDRSLENDRLSIFKAVRAYKDLY